MEQHPVPQNVTTFQFRLVGDMTIKQFGYLAGGIIVGYLCYKLPLPFFFTWPLAIASGLLGFGLAFVPVEERPMDVWIASFFKNVYSPTQWVWQKEKQVQAPPASIPVSQPQKPAPAPTSPVRPAPQKTQPAPAYKPPTPPTNHATLSIRHAASPLEWLTSIFRSNSKPPAALRPSGLSFADALAVQSSPSVVGRRPDLAQPQKPAPPPPHQPSAPQPVAPSASFPQPTARPAIHERVVELQTQLSEALAQRERLEKELVAIRNRMDQQTKSAPPTQMRQASVSPVAPSSSTTTVRIIAPENAAKAGLPRLTTFPNVVTGIVKDSYGNLLTGILITVRDHGGTPLRALKTNKLGQFAASTPLPNNTYLVEIEDPKSSFVFDKAQISLNGTVAPPIEVIAKSQKQVERDKLAKEIFGGQMQ